MRKFVVLIIAIIFAASCTYRNKKNYLLAATVNRYNGDNGCPVKLSREYYHAFSGFMTSDMNALYLTDSTNFRMNLGLYDTEYERVNTTCKGDLLIIEKRTKLDSREAGSTIVIDADGFTQIIKVELKVYSLKQLREDGNFAF